MSDDDLILHRRQPPETTQPPEHPTVSQRAKWTFWAAGIAVIISFIALVFSFLQATAAIDQSRIAQSQFDLAKKTSQEQAKDIERSRKAVEVSANAAQASVDTLHDQLKQNAILNKINLASAELATNLQLRPYVNVTEMQVVARIRNGQTLKGTAKVLNSGRTPAVHVRGCFDVVMLDLNDPPTDDFPCPAPARKEGAELKITEFSIGAGSSFPTYSFPMKVEFDVAMTLTSIRYYFYGDLSYADILKPRHEHHTKFCGRLNSISGVMEVRASQQYGLMRQMGFFKHNTNAD